MSDAKEKNMSDVYDSLNAERPLRMEAIDNSIPARSARGAVKSVTGNAGRTSSAKERDVVQHSHGSMKAILGFLAVRGSAKHLINTHTYKKYQKKLNEYKATAEDLKYKPGGNGSGGRSVAECLLAERQERAQKKFNKFMAKHPDFQRPLSFGQRMQASRKLLLSSLGTAARTNMMRGMLGPQGGNKRAMAASLVASSIPGEEYSGECLP